MQKRKIKKVLKSVAQWGYRDTPLLPVSLRQLWADEALPTWVRADLGLTPDATFDALGATIWNTAPTEVPRRVRNFVINTVAARCAELEDVRVLSRPWPPELAPSSLPLTVRTRNCLERSGLDRDRATLSAVTFARILEVPSMGIVSVLDLACVAEAAMDQIDSSRIFANEPLSSQASTRADPSSLLIDAIDEAWVNEVSAQDPRFAELLPPGEGTVFEQIDQLTGQPSENTIEEEELAEALAIVRGRVDELAGQPLDLALRQFLEAISSFTGAKLDALLARFGWAGEPPTTLDAAGSIAGVSRERIRQLQKRILGRTPPHPVFMPQLDEAMALLAKNAPLDVENASILLRDAGITSVSFHPESVLRAAAICGHTAPFEVERIHGRSHVVTIGVVAGAARPIFRIAKAQAGASGASHLAEVVAEATTGGINIDETLVRSVLTLYSDAEFLEDDWFWYPNSKIDRNRLRNVTRKMLSVASPISLAVIREGIRREFKYRGVRGLGTWPLIVPPKSVIARLYEAHPEFGVNSDGLVASAMPLDYRSELKATEQVFVDVLRSSPACVLDRASCYRGCIERGMNPNTFSLYLTYSPVIAHLGTDIWSLRGVRVDPAAVEAVRRANAARPEAKRVLDHGWTDAGNLWVAARLPVSTQNFVFNIPAAARRFIAGRDFPVADEKGTSHGTVRVSAEGMSHGYGVFLRRSGADEDDILMAEFNLASGNCVLRLGDDEILEELNPAL